MPKRLKLKLPAYFDSVTKVITLIGGLLLTREESYCNRMSIIFRKDDLANKAELEEKLWELQGYVTRYLRTFDLGEGLLDDAVQETMINAWMHIDQLRDVSRMKWWVRSIAMNVGLKYVKMIKQKLSREISLETRLENVASEEEEAMLCQALSVYVEKADLGRIKELLSCLGKKEKNIILLQYVFQHSLKEVAKITGESYANTRKISSRAIAKMREYAAKEESRGK